jgi:hypothetical protein
VAYAGPPVTTRKRAAIFVHPPVDQPPPFEPIVAAGMKALANGTASDGQQKAVFDWLLKEAAGIGKVAFRHDAHSTAFMEGRRFVGVLMIHLTEWKAPENG